MEQHILAWIAHYGYFAIFALLMFGIVGLPVPDETLLTFGGYLVYKGNFSLPLFVIAAWAGSACGITISFYLGRIFGMGLIHRYGKYLHVSEAQIQRAHAWFDRAGHWSLTFGYFIPGVRHVTAFAAGMSAVTQPQFSLFAYSGGFLWVSAFVSLGYFLGERWQTVEGEIEHYIVVVSIAAGIAIAAYLVWRKWVRPKPGV
jgi:membrane protein DedA with SNARE-associated domain